MQSSARPPDENRAPWQDPLERIESGEALPVEMFLTFKVNQLSSAFERQWTRFMRDEAGVSLSEWRILAMLQALPLTFARVVEATDLNKALAHRSAGSLARAGLITIDDTPGDARSTTLSLTAAGRRLFRKIQPLALARQRHFLGALSATERRTLYAALGKLRRAADDWDATRLP